MTCFECGNTAHHNHHVIPKSLGGTKTIPLCESCHGKVHDRKFVSHRALTKAGQDKARKAGKQIGRAEVFHIGHPAVKLIMNSIDSGNSLRVTAELLQEKSIKTARGQDEWKHSTIKKIYERFEDYCFD